MQSSGSGFIVARIAGLAEEFDQCGMRSLGKLNRRIQALLIDKHPVRLHCYGGADALPHEKTGQQPSEHANGIRNLNAEVTGSYSFQPLLRRGSADRG